MLGGEFGGFAEGDDAGYILRAAAPFAFLTTAHEQRRKADTLADVERANTLRRMHFVPAEAEKINRRRPHIEVNFSCRLHGIDPYTYLVDVLQRVGQHPASRVEELTPRLWKERFAANPLRSLLHSANR